MDVPAFTAVSPLLTSIFAPPATCCTRTSTAAEPRSARPITPVRAAADPLGPSTPPRATGPFSAARDFLAGIRRATGLSSVSEDDTFDIDRVQLFADDDRPPEVLVVGATGETGRIITRKLILRGYRVRVLVRDLYSKTLDILGTGVSYVKGDLNDYDSLLEATGDVDKVICSVGVRDPALAESVEYEGIANLVRAFQDSRVQLYGRAEATKLVLYNFGDEKHLSKWKRVISEEGDEGARPPHVNFKITAPNRVAFMGHIFSKYSGLAEIRTTPSRVNLRGFSGLLLRCVGDGKPYFVVLRTVEGIRAGVEYVATFTSHQNKWESIRIPLSEFLPYSLTDGALKNSAPRLDRGDIRQMAIQYRKPEESPEKDDGRFYLGVDYMKTYRTQEEPDFVLVSCASVTARDFSELDEQGLRAAGKEDIAAWKYLAENRLRQSGLTYCIVRPGSFTEQPGGNKALILEQDGDVAGAISRADLAEICVMSLLDPRACNVMFDAFESMYAPSATIPQQDVSSMLSRLRPNT